jgi:DNA-binding transcriptional ArsR family regulator
VELGENGEAPVGLAAGYSGAESRGEGVRGANNGPVDKRPQVMPIRACMRTRARLSSRAPTETRRRAVRELDGILEAKVFRALCEPARIEILKLLTLWGRSDVATIADGVPQHRSVISRHLAQLHEAGFLRREKVGRNVFFEMDGPAVVAQLEDVVDRFRNLVPHCCPGRTSEAQGRRKTA